jgi:nitrite reductase/ring-hydroxylating ferredoxin subunit
MSSVRDLQRWFAVARSEEVIARHVVESMLLGQDLAVWRDDAGAVNAWENRCPHRGVRFSIGFNTGQELRCRYHGWRFASGNGQCQAIPAHPTQKPASAMRATVYGVAERHGFVWARLGDDPTAPQDPPLPASLQLPAVPVTIRSLFMRAPATAVASALRHGFASEPAPDAVHGAAAAAVPAGDEYTLGGTGVLYLLQPVSDAETIVHGLLTGPVPAADRLQVLRRHNARLADLRRAIERPA